MASLYGGGGEYPAPPLVVPGQPTDWSQPMRFVGPFPPEPPEGAPGNWIYRGRRRGRRRWLWQPVPDAQPFWWPPPGSVPDEGADATGVGGPGPFAEQPPAAAFAANGDTAGAGAPASAPGEEPAPSGFPPEGGFSPQGGFPTPGVQGGGASASGFDMAAQVAQNGGANGGTEQPGM